MRRKINFASRLKLITGFTPKARKIYIYENQKSYILPASCSDQRALRDRHERWRQDAMDALMRKTGEIKADGKIVWSRHPDAGVKFGGLAMTALTVRPAAQDDGG